MGKEKGTARRNTYIYIYIPETKTRVQRKMATSTTTTTPTPTTAFQTAAAAVEAVVVVGAAAAGDAGTVGGTTVATTTSSSGQPAAPTPSDYYKTWISYESIKMAVDETNARSVWKLLFHFPKKGDHRNYWEPVCWSDQPIMKIRPQLVDRIQWYYNNDDHDHDDHHDRNRNIRDGSTTGSVGGVDDGSNVDDTNSNGCDGSNNSNGRWFKECQAYFVGHHQLIELVLLFMKPSIDHLYTLIKMTGKSDDSNDGGCTVGGRGGDGSSSSLGTDGCCCGRGGGIINGGSAKSTKDDSDGHIDSDDGGTGGNSGSTKTTTTTTSATTTTGKSNNTIMTTTTSIISKQLSQDIVKECTHISNGWYIIGDLIKGVGALDRIRYLKYVPRLLGVSGGNSPLMMSLSSRTAQLDVHCTCLHNMSIEQLAYHIQNETTIGLVIEGFIDCLDALSRCWFEHVVTSTTSIGLTKGTKGTPNIILAQRVLNRLHNSKLLLALGSLRQCTQTQDITPQIGIEMCQLYEYSTVYPLSDHYLDLFVDPATRGSSGGSGGRGDGGDMTPDFACHSFGYLPREYEIAKRDFLKLRLTNSHYRHNKLWEQFYTKIRPEFCTMLKSKLLGIQLDKYDDCNGNDGTDGGSGTSTDLAAASASSANEEADVVVVEDTDTTVGIGLGSSVTEVLTRILSSILMNRNSNIFSDAAAATDRSIGTTTNTDTTTFNILMPNDEFVTLQRCVAIFQNQWNDNTAGGGVVNCKIDKVTPDVFEEIVTNNDSTSASPNITTYDLIVYSLVNSCTQRVMNDGNMDWIRNNQVVHNKKRNTTAVIVDITQAVGNIPLYLDDIARHPNVYFVGSLVKHARCGEGLGFLTYCSSPTNITNYINGIDGMTNTGDDHHQLLLPPASGWIANLSGLVRNETLLLIDVEDDDGDDSNNGTMNNNNNTSSSSLLYDCIDHMWEGGTPSFVESAYVATRIWNNCNWPSMEDQYKYVHDILHPHFLQRCYERQLLLSPEQIDYIVKNSKSNTIAIPVVVSSKHQQLLQQLQQPPPLPFGLDYKIVNDNQIYLRIGFGIHCLPYHVDILIDYLTNTTNILQLH